MYINNGKSHKTLAEELTAFVSTVIAFNDGELNGIDAKMFKDTSPVLDAWHNIFDEYNLFENQSNATDAIEHKAYNKEKGVEENGDERRTRQNRRRNSGRGSEDGIQSSQNYIDLSKLQYNSQGNSEEGGRIAEKGEITNRLIGEQREIGYRTENESYICSFKEIPSSEYSSEVKVALQLFEKAGIDSYVFDNNGVNITENGQTETVLCNGATICGGKSVLICNNLESMNGVELFSHEMFHIGLQNNKCNISDFESFHISILKNIVPDNYVYKYIVDFLSDSYDISDTDIFSEEFSAWVSSVIGSNNNWEYYSQMFKNPDEVRTAWAKAFKNYLPENTSGEDDVRYQLDIPEDIDNNKDIAYNKEKGAEENGDERRTRQNRRGNSGRRAENSLYNSKRYIDLSEPSYFRGRTLEKGKGISQRSTRTRVFARNGRTEIEYSYPNG